MSKYIAVTTIHHGRPEKDLEGKTYSKTEIVEPGQTLPSDLTIEQIAALVASGAACDEKDYEKVKKIRAVEAEKYAPRLVDEKDEDAGSYDPAEAARKVLAKNGKSDEGSDETAEPKTGKTKEPETPEDKGKTPKPQMSKVELLAIAKERNVEVDETLSRDEVYKVLTEKK